MKKCSEYAVTAQRPLNASFKCICFMGCRVERKINEYAVGSVVFTAECRKLLIWIGNRKRLAYSRRSYLLQSRCAQVIEWYWADDDHYRLPGTTVTAENWQMVLITMGTQSQSWRVARKGTVASIWRCLR